MEVPRSHHPLEDLLGEDEVLAYLDNVRGVIAKCVDVMPDHAAYSAEHCAAPARTRSGSTG
jgi:tryptophan halogenase